MEKNHTIFELDGHRCEVIAPDTPAEGRPFVFRTEFFHAFDTVDRALLARGYHLCYCNYSDEYGSPAAIEVFRTFHRYLTTWFGLSEKASLFGFSRGGLYAINYALAYPKAVACLYLDAPVVDLGSWPAGFGTGCGSPDEWRDCYTRVIGVEDPKEAVHWRHNPINRLPALAKLALPTLLIAGDSDRVVPYEENGALLEKAYREAGADITVILKKGCDHHPHSIEDPTPAVEFIEQANREG